MKHFNFTFKLLLLYILIMHFNSGISDHIKRFEREKAHVVGVNEEVERKGSHKFLRQSDVTHQLQNSFLPCPFKNCHSNAQYLLEELTLGYSSSVKYTDSNVNEIKSLDLYNQLIKQIQQTCLDDRTRHTNCTDSKFRNFDGSCNNLERPNDGRTYTCLRRLLKPNYADGVKEPRTGVNGFLPESRILSRALHRMQRFSPVTTKVNAMHMSYGQFLDHDMEFTQIFRINNITTIDCCHREIPYHPQCFPIEIYPDDPDFKNMTCMNFVRNVACPTCKLGWREQMNTLPSAIDCSQIYGTSEEAAMSLRNLSGNGELAVRMISGVGPLPLADTQPRMTGCNIPKFECFKMGDLRVNQNLLLTTLHVMFLRFHNFVARHLRKLNSHWNGDRIYLESRRFVGACMQHIVYEEYLPLLLGPEIMKSYHLDDVTTRYNSRLSLSIYNNFAAASFRFGHSTVPNAYLTVSEKGKVGKIFLKDTFFNPMAFYQGKLEDLVRGATLQYQDSFDRILSRSVGKHLYQERNETLGLDLASLNIQRGRDHGLPGYKFFVEKMFNFSIKKFRDLHRYGLINERNMNMLQYLYNNEIQDIDLFVGILLESQLKNSLLGPTAANLIAKQFFDLKYGDRYFYTHIGETGSFTLDQKATIREVFLSNIICITTKIKKISHDAMVPTSPVVPCSHFKPINFLPWKEKKISHLFNGLLFY